MNPTIENHIWLTCKNKDLYKMKNLLICGWLINYLSRSIMEVMISSLDPLAVALWPLHQLCDLALKSAITTVKYLNSDILIPD